MNVLSIKREFNSHLTPNTGSQGNQVGYAPDFHPGGPDSSLAWGNLPKNRKTIQCRRTIKIKKSLAKAYT